MNQANERGTTERTFLSEQGVLVTNARFVAHNQTYAMGGITSVKTMIEGPSSGFPVIMLIVGVLVLLGCLAGAEWKGALVGAALVGLAILILKSQKATHHLVLRTASGEVRAISSQDQTRIARILAAINDAIVARG